MEEKNKIKILLAKQNRNMYYMEGIAQAVPSVLFFRTCSNENKNETEEFLPIYMCTVCVIISIEEAQGEINTDRHYVEK